MAAFEFIPCTTCASPMACRDVGQCVGSMAGKSYRQLARKIEANANKPQSELKNVIVNDDE